MTKYGDCYEANGKFLLELDRLQKADSWRISHGTATGRGRIKGLEHGHCWLELDGKIVIDLSNGRQVVMEKEHYYALGKIKDVKTYTADEFREKILAAGHWGCFK
jgi:hypothetical protein